MSTLKKKTILVTGGAGFIGSHIVDAFIKKGYRVSVIDNLSTGKRENLNSKAIFYKLDIQSPEISKVFKKEKPAYVFHYAAQVNLRKSIENPIQDAKINILGSLNIFLQCKEYKVKKIIFASTGGAMYGEASMIPTPETYPVHPASPYGISKLAVEYYLSSMQVPFVALRFANVYGPRQDSKGEAGVVAIFIRALVSGKIPVIFGTGRQTRDFVFVEDVVRSSILALKGGKTGIFNVGTGKESSVNDVLKFIKNITGSSVKASHGASIKGEAHRSSLNSSKIRKVLGWKPEYSFKQGLGKTIESFR